MILKKAIDNGKVVEEFYKDFEVHVKHADEAMEKVVIKDEPAGEDCELCGSPMVFKLGRYGKFMACSNFPDCRNTKAIMKPIGVKCPSCETGEIVERKVKQSVYSMVAISILNVNLSHGTSRLIDHVQNVVHY